MIQQNEFHKPSSQIGILEASNIINPENFYPAEILSNGAFVEQLNQRQNLNTILRNIFSKIQNPLTEISDALKEGQISVYELSELYSELTQFLNADENNRRILLYLPFTLLPKSPDDFSDNLKTIYQAFLKKYAESWYLLLGEREPRASFIDGDVLEEGMQQPKRVRKAAHLIPQLIGRSIISVDEVITLIETSEDFELVESLLEGLLSAYYQGIVSNESLKKLIRISQYNHLVRTALNSVKLKIVHSKSQDQGFNEIDDLLLQFEKEISEAQINPNDFNYSEGRRVWLENKTKESIIDKYSKLIAKDFYSQILHISSDKYPQLILKSVFESCQSKLYISLDEMSIINQHWINSNSRDRDIIINGLTKLSRLGLIDEDTLKLFGIEISDLSLGSVNPERFESEIFEFTKAFELISQHPILSKYIYQTAILFGSKIKGYASSNSDLDVAIFFKPEAEFADRDVLLQSLKQIPPFSNIDKFLEFWLDTNKNGYSFKTPENKIGTVMSAAEIHILFNGMWIGNVSSDLRNSIVQKYFDLRKFGVNQGFMRSHLLRQLELDALQFRIMHKGYRNLYPSSKISGPNHSELIDWESDFWDEGYRRTATLLFLSKVFLPNLSVEQ